MKKIIIALAFLTSLNSFAGVFLTCSSKDVHEGGEGVVSDNILLFGEFKFSCKDFKGNDYSIQMKGVGPGIEFNPDAAVAVACPSVSKKRLNSRGKVILGAVNVSAAIIGGVTEGIALNHRGGMCLVSGFTTGFGASIKIGYLKIMKGSLESNGIKAINRFGFE